MPRTDDVLARSLGVASLALGVPQVAAPDRFAEAIGIKPTDEVHAWMLAVGARELAAATGLLALDARRATAYARVVGDLKDVALLVAALQSSSRDRDRTLAALGAVAGITALDVFAAVRFSRKAAVEAAKTQVRSSVTIARPAEEVEAAWPGFDSGVGTTGAELSEHGDVRFVPAPGERGTEVHVDLRFGGPSGPVGTAALKLTGKEPQEVVKDHLRRFKQVLETGEVVRSDASPEGQRAARMLKQRPAQPVPAS